jgi:hypothetical protein
MCYRPAATTFVQNPLRKTSPSSASIVQLAKDWGGKPESLARNWARFMNWVLAVDGSGFIFWKHCVGLVVERRECLGWKETAAMVFLS